MNGVIVSDPESGVKSYGLTPHGRQQVLEVSDIDMSKKVYQYLIFFA